MIIRKWHGYTSRSSADEYERLLREEIIPEIEGKKIRGYRGFQVLRRNIEPDEVEFITLIKFKEISAVKDFVGDKHEQVYVPERARRILKRFDKKAVHYDLKFSSVHTDSGSNQDIL